LDYALNCAGKYTRVYIIINILIYIYLVCANGLAGPNCSLTCNCEFGECNVNATSEADKCICSHGYTGLTCNQYINYCDPGTIYFVYLLIVVFLLVADICNGNITNRICQLAPTNSDTSNINIGYSCPCRNGYEPSLNSDVCQGMLFFEIKNVYCVYVFLYRY
jgi:hypothetical protein